MQEAKEAREKHHEGEDKSISNPLNYYSAPVTNGQVPQNQQVSQSISSSQNRSNGVYNPHMSSSLMDGEGNKSDFTFVLSQPLADV